MRPWNGLPDAWRPCDEAQTRLMISPWSAWPAGSLAHQISSLSGPVSWQTVKPRALRMRESEPGQFLLQDVIDAALADAGMAPDEPGSAGGPWCSSRQPNRQPTRSRLRLRQPHRACPRRLVAGRPRAGEPGYHRASMRTWRWWPVCSPRSSPMAWQWARESASWCSNGCGTRSGTVTGSMPCSRGVGVASTRRAR